MKKEEIILIGGGGHCRSCIDVINISEKYKIKGIIDTEENVGKNVMGIPIIGSDKDLQEILKECNQALITVGHIKSNSIRVKLFKKAKAMGYQFPVIISPNAFISPSSSINQGTIVMHNVIISSNVKIGENCIINNRALIEHDCEVGDFSHISTGAILNGEVEVKSNCFIGSGSVLRNGITITDDVLLGMNSSVLKDVKKSGTYYGNPIKKIINE